MREGGKRPPVHEYRLNMFAMWQLHLAIAGSAEETGIISEAA